MCERLAYLSQKVGSGPENFKSPKNSKKTPLRHIIRRFVQRGGDNGRKGQQPKKRK